MTQNQKLTPLMESILEVIEKNGGTVKGTELLTLSVTTLNTKADVIAAVRRLKKQGAIHVKFSNGGRGHKTTFKRNRNSPGYARKHKRP